MTSIYAASILLLISMLQYLNDFIVSIEIKEMINNIFNALQTSRIGMRSLLDIHQKKYI